MSSRSFAAWPVPELHPPKPRDPAAAEPIGPSLAEEAFATGLTEGQRLGRDEADRRLAGAIQALSGAAESLRAVQASFSAEMEDHVFALAVAVAQQLVEREVTAEPTIVRELVRRAIDTLPLEGTLEIRLHPADLAALEGRLELFAPGGRRLDVQWVAEPSLERGGYMIETPQRVVDGRVDQALHAIYERLRDG